MSLKCGERELLFVAYALKTTNFNWFIANALCNKFILGILKEVHLAPPFFCKFGGMEFNKLITVPSLSDIKKVALLLDGVVKRTPLEYSVPLSDRYGAQIFLKREDLQTVRSYKIRGAYFKISNIPESLRSQGIVAASAGNHAQGVAFACAKMKIKGNIFMPKFF